ncbi:DUF4178 domain-containing protein [Epibacterium sp. MM17-32]|uniref:DUF4178 domain-containing protein n=1 Tax=Epibacterium sp. MM17-32 TaxID=2917734 RepID=UPI001EF5A9FA|nr:DUF4178 domain-containing protein [Epibacterium sp. MM17-32]MCG7630024.1 DUF4178 domain-containing protein [Epibacterium sp. MM17-32]
MTRSAALVAINCTCCGAGLDVLGGGRVEVHICPYCGSTLNAQDNYKLLGQHDRKRQTSTPIEIGMRCHLHGVDYTVIGLIEQYERWAGQSALWVDFQLYSPTHGYVWLTLENDHLTLSRRVRTSRMLTPAEVERAPAQPRLKFRGMWFKYYETSTSEAIYVAGEFSYRPQIADRVTTVTVVAARAALHFSRTGQEDEVEISTYVTPAEANDAFGTDLGLRPSGVHPEQPLRKGPNHDFLRRLWLCGAGLCLLLALILSGGRGSTVLNTTYAVNDLPVEVPFAVATANQLVEIELSGPVNNSWAYFDMEVTGPEDDPLFGIGRGIEYYTGSDKDGRWSEGNRTARVRFRPETPGTHALFLDLSEAGNWPATAPGTPIREVSLTVREGLTSGSWALRSGLFFIALFALMTARQVLHHARRWQGCDWTDED